MDGSVSNPKGYPLGPGEKNANPNFVNYADRDVHLQQTSPAVNVGVSLGYKTDLDGNVVPQGTAPDMGAYEFFEIEER